MNDVTRTSNSLVAQLRASRFISDHSAINGIRWVEAPKLEKEAADEIERLQLQFYALTNANKSLADAAAGQPPNRHTLEPSQPSNELCTWLQNKARYEQEEIRPELRENGYSEALMALTSQQAEILRLRQDAERLPASTRICHERGYVMSTMGPVPKDHPLMIAWEAHKATEDYANSKRWASAIHKDAHLEGSLWALFMAGFHAASSHEPRAPLAHELASPDAWTCRHCGSINRPGDAACYHCKRPSHRAAQPPSPDFAKALERYASCLRSWEQHHGCWETERLEKATAELHVAARATQPPMPSPGTATMYAQQHNLAVTAEWCRGWNAHMDALEELPPSEVAERSLLASGFQMPSAPPPPVESDACTICGQPMGEHDVTGIQREPLPQGFTLLCPKRCRCGGQSWEPGTVEIQDSLGGMHYDDKPCSTSTKPDEQS